MCLAHHQEMTRTFDFQSSSALWVSTSTIALSLLTGLLMLSTFFHVAPGVFAAFVLFNGIAQAVAGSYLQTSVVAVASRFGPSAMQAVMSGQAVVAVVVSGVQVITAAASVWGLPDEAIATFKVDSETESRSAFVFFGISTIFLVATTAAHKWFVAQPVYRTVVGRSEPKSATEPDDDPDDQQALMPGGPTVQALDKKRQIFLVARANVVYEVSVALVFIVTLVSVTYCVYSPCRILSSVRFPPDHDINPSHKPQNPSIPIQCYPLPRIQRRGPPWPACLCIPSAAYVVCKESSHILARARTIYSTISNVQCPEAFFILSVSPIHQFRFSVHAHPACIRVVQRLLINYVHDVCTILGTQPEVEGQEGRCGRSCYGGKLLSCRWASGWECSKLCC